MTRKSLPDLEIIVSSLQQHVKEVFDGYKCKATWDPLVSLPVYDGQQRLMAYMKPIIKDYRISDPNLPDLLNQWRTENPTISTATFKLTTERTMKWLDNLIIGRDDKILFILQACDGTPLGHLGYSDFDFENESGCVDSVLRGVKSGYPGLMTFAMITLMRWGFQILRLKEIRLSVFSDNHTAVRFYEKFGFVQVDRKPLHRIEANDEIKWELAPPDYQGPIEKYYLYMKFDPTRCPPHILEGIGPLPSEISTR